MEATNQKLDEVQRKLRKLQKLYESAKSINSEGEANAAAAAIQRILMEYNLTMEEIGVEKDQNVIEREEWNGYTYKTIGGWWEQKLVAVLCRYNFCRCFIYGSSYKRLCIIGTAENKEMVKWLREFLSEKYVQLSKEAYKKYVAEFQPRLFHEKPMSKDKFQRSFLAGCADGLDIKLREEREADKKDVEIGTKVCALVLRKDKELQEYVEREFGKLGHCHRKTNNFDGAYCSGVTTGKNTDIHRPISGTRSAANGVKALC